MKKGSTSYAQITVAASSAFGDADEDTSITETAFEMDEQIKVETAKSTAGGRAILFLTVEVLPLIYMVRFKILHGIRLCSVKAAPLPWTSLHD